MHVHCPQMMEPQYSVNSELLARIRQEVTPSFLKKALVYAIHKVRGKFWRGVWNGQMPGGKLAEDFVHDALNDVMFGKRNWNPDSVPDFFVFLCGVVDSKISHLAEKKENTKEERFVDVDVEGEPSFFENLRDGGVRLPCDEVITTETEDANERLLFALIDFVKDDPLLPKLLECILDGVTSRSEKAQKLGVHPSDITQAQKRLERRLRDFAKKFAHLNPFKTL